ncbi:Rieske (2Fe-2S) protein [Ancylomarina longa]|uniref:Rieske domain-containing protein n=1 Tax=Ancylomarina longa TaxID=2487017 RepID=A0A434AXT3_9BACT|nr:hypothetical protein [Ancylomarina longa]RUT79268.1 hypothetical protein DLK05_03330 [Ancylomarina longa]
MKQSNLLYFFLLLGFSSVFCSCSSNSNNDEIVPSWHINSTVYLDFFSELNSVGNALYFDAIGGESVGYRNHGIIVVKLNSGYAAYDATCTHDVDVDEHVELDEDYSGIYTCPICGSQFNILGGAYPLDGSVAKYPLKVYKTSYSSSSRTLRIYN